jgi:O-acetyl-ADP-ribose deacetylase (regulator of RNase III)
MIDLRLDVVVHACNLRYLGGRGVQGHSEQKWKTPSEKQNKAKRAGGMAQVVEVFA